MNKKTLRWLYDELPRLVSSGIVPPDVADAIRKHYGELPIGSGRKLAVLICGILGATLIGSGVILLLAHNWEDLSRTTRTALAFVPLASAIALAAFVLACRRDNAAWSEGVAVFWALSIGASISLVAQIYHIHGDAARFFLTWSLLGLPVVYLMRSGVAASLYFIGATTYAGCAANLYSRGEALWYWGVIALVMPPVVKWWRNDKYAWRAVLTSWALGICLCLGIGFSLEGTMRGSWIGAYTGLFALLYLAGARWCDDAPSLWQRPWQTVGAFGLGIVALMLTFKWPWREFRYEGWRIVTDDTTILIVANLFVALLPITAILLAAREARHARWTDLDKLMAGLAPLCGVIGYAIAATTDNVPVPQIIFNIYLFALGLGTLIAGIRANKLSRVNTGLLALAALIIARFFDSNMSFLVRGAAFIIVGAGFLVTNLVVLHRKGAQAQ